MHPLIKRITAGGPTRISRMHTARGEFVGVGVDTGQAALSCLLRKIAGVRPRLPWLTYPAIEYLQKHVRRQDKVFEFGGGMSTLFYESRCGEVYTVEDNYDWYRHLESRAQKARLFFATGNEYIRKVQDFPPEYFDLIVVDGSVRERCFRAAEPHVRRGGMIVVDDTDKADMDKEDMFGLDQFLRASPSYRVRRFPGWVPGCCFVKETTICERL